MRRVRLASLSTIVAVILAGGLAQGCSDSSGLHPGRVQDPDASPLAPEPGACAGADDCGHLAGGVSPTVPQAPESAGRPPSQAWRDARSEEHTSELQSLMRISYAVFCLKKKNNSRKQTK